MKKLIAIIMALVIILPVVALAELPDITSFSDQELKDLISACSAELMTRRTYNPEGILLFEYEGAKVYQTGKATVDSSGHLRVPVVVYNDMDCGIAFGAENVICNGWDVAGGGVKASAKAKSKENLLFLLGDAEITSLEQIESLRFKLTVTNTDTFMYLYKQEELEERRFW